MGLRSSAGLVVGGGRRPGPASRTPLLTATLVVRGDHTPPGLRTQLFATAASLKISAGAAGAALAGVAAGMGGPTLLAFIAASQVASALAGCAAGRMGADRVMKHRLRP